MGQVLSLFFSAGSVSRIVVLSCAWTCLRYDCMAEEGTLRCRVTRVEATLLMNESSVTRRLCTGSLPTVCRSTLDRRSPRVRLLIRPIVDIDVRGLTLGSRRMLLAPSV